MGYILKNDVYVIEEFSKYDVFAGFGTKELTLEELEKISERVDKILVTGTQTHSKNIVILKKNCPESDALINEAPFPDTDGLITDREDLILYTKHADCQGIYFYDTINRVIGICHSGWKGSFQEISIEMIKLMEREFKSNIENIIVGIGIGISKEIYEVSYDFMEKFLKKYEKKQLESSFSEINGKIYFDNEEFNKNLLKMYGIKEENIAVSDQCTYKNEGLHSYRRDKENSGRNLGFIYLEGHIKTAADIFNAPSNEETRDEFLRKKEGIYRISLYLSEIFLKNGGETYKVEGMVESLCRSKGIFYANILVTPTFIVMGDDRADGITFVKNIKGRTINLKKVELVNNYYEELLKADKVDFQEVIIKLRKIDKHREYSEWFRVFAAGGGAAAFGALFDIGINEIGLIFILTITSVYISNKITKLFKAGILGVIFACIMLGLLSFYGAEHGYIKSSHSVIIGSILPFLPGVAITKSVIDLVHGDYIAGNSRAIEATLAALSIGVGIGLAMNIWVRMGGTI